MKKTTKEASDNDWTLADPEALEVKPEFQRLIPLQAKGELMALEDSVKEEGVRDPLLVWKGHNIILDGHTRRELAIKHKKPVKIHEVELVDEKAAIEFILKIQRERRNLTREAMSYFRGTEYNAVKQQRGGDRRSGKSKGPEVPSVSTAEKLAKKYGVVDKTIKRDGMFALAIDQIVSEHGEPEIRRQLLGADIRLTQGLARLLLKKPSAERKAAVNQLLEQGELPRAKKKEAAEPPKPKDVAKTLAKSLITRLKAKGDDHARSVLQQMARMMGMKVVEKNSAK